MKDVSFRCSVRFSSSIALKNFKRGVVAISSSAQKVLRQQNLIFFHRCHEWIRVKLFRSIKSLKPRQKFQFSSLHSRTIDFEQLCAEARFNFNENLPYQDRQNNILEFLDLIVFSFFSFSSRISSRDTSRKLKTITKRKQFLINFDFPMNLNYEDFTQSRKWKKMLN